MQEMMVDLETLDTRVGAVVLSIGAVVWSTKMTGFGDLIYKVEDRFMRKLNMDEQFAAMRSVSQSTLLWWMQQDPTARAEAFDPVRQPVESILQDFYGWATEREDKDRINHFWASPATFDFPIIETLAEQFVCPVPWRYNQKYDVRTVVNEASYSAKDHVARPDLVGIAHTPVYDCEWQIDLLTAARNRISRRIMS